MPFVYVGWVTPSWCTIGMVKGSRRDCRFTSCCVVGLVVFVFSSVLRERLRFFALFYDPVGVRWFVML